MTEKISIADITIRGFKAVLDAMSKLCETGELLIGEVKLLRETEEKKLLILKTIADCSQKTENNTFMINDDLIEILGSSEKIRGNTNVLQAEVSRITNFCKTGKCEI